MPSEYPNPNVWVVWLGDRSADRKETVGVYENETLARERIDWVENRRSFEEGHETGTVVVPVDDAIQLPEWIWIVRTGTVTEGYTGYDRAYASEEAAVRRVDELRSSSTWDDDSITAINEWTVRSRQHFQSLLEH